MGAEILQFGVDEMQGMTWLDPAKKAGIGDMTLERWSALVDTMVGLKLGHDGTGEAGGVLRSPGESGRPVTR